MEGKPCQWRATHRRRARWGDLVSSLHPYGSQPWRQQHPSVPMLLQQRAQPPPRDLERGRRAHAASSSRLPGVAAVRCSCPADAVRRSRRRRRPPQPLSAPSDPAAAAAVGRRPPQPPVRGRPTQPLQQPSAAVRSSRRPSQPSFFPLDLFAWLSRFPHGFHGFTPQTKQSTASLVGLHGPVPTRAGDRDVGTIWVRCGLVPGFSEPTNRATTYNNNNDNNKEAKFSPIFWYRNIALTGQGGCNRFPPASRSSTPPPSPAKPLHTSPEFPPPNHAYLAHIPLSHHRGSRCSRDGDGGTSSLPEI